MRLCSTPSRLARRLLGLAVLVTMAACSTRPPALPPVGELLMPDLRFFCPDPLPIGAACRTPVTELPPELAQLLAANRLGGVILFAENLVAPEQIRRLTAALQAARHEAGSAPPLLIAIDQEGGRVARLPRDQFPPFAGNMAIGATRAKYGDHYARLVGTRIGADLAALGFNVNFAPNVDVNNNPRNPVINVRSFGDDPLAVAELGAAFVTAMQQQGVAATAKHFPGHGDTHTDSHAALPRVEHDRATVDRIDLAPYRELIRRAPPQLIMSAHIQYPALDASTLPDRNGVPVTVPATLSKRMLTDLLRTELGYRGVIVSDAMNMAGITAHWDSEFAVKQTLRAGADLVLMPIPIRSPADMPLLADLVRSLQQEARRDETFAARLEVAIGRVRALRTALATAANKKRPSAVVTEAETPQQLSDAALTLVHNRGALLPLSALHSERLLLVLPDREKCAALLDALHVQAVLPLTEPGPERQWPRCLSQLQAADETTLYQLLPAASAVIVGSLTPNQSVAEMGGVDDAETVTELQRLQTGSVARLRRMVMAVQGSGKPWLALSLRSPYDLATLAPCASAAVALYHYGVESAPGVLPVQGTAYVALARLLAGSMTATGSLPVQIPALDSPCSVQESVR